MKGRVLGLDFGDKTIGVAVSDELRITAQPVKTIERIGIKKDMGAVAQIVEEYEVKEIVIGLPLNMDGSTGEMAEAVLNFTKRLDGRVSIPIHTWDERLTTVAAERSLIESGVRRKKRREVIDQAAAVLILQGWLELNGDS